MTYLVLHGRAYLEVPNVFHKGLVLERPGPGCPSGAEDGWDAFALAGPSNP